jgi:NADPH-dependent 2,4-dienoyl-CoA reductase/sulfur reductase-like enzyme
MGSLIEELQRREAAAHQKADELCGEINAVERAAGAGRGEVVPGWRLHGRRLPGSSAMPPGPAGGGGGWPGTGRLAAGRSCMKKRPDVLVAGAGPAGLALALQAHDHGAVDRGPGAVRRSRAPISSPRA